MRLQKKDIKKGAFETDEDNEEENDEEEQIPLLDLPDMGSLIGVKII